MLTLGHYQNTGHLYNPTPTGGHLVALCQTDLTESAQVETVPLPFKRWPFQRIFLSSSVM